MKSIRFNMLFLLLVAGLVFQSCEQEDALTLDDSALRGGGNGGNGGNDDGDGPPSMNNNVQLLDNDVLHDWTALLLDIERYATGMRPNATARALAYIYLAGYETAVPGMREHRSNTRNLDGLRIRSEERPRNIDWELALNATFASTLDHFLLNVSDDLKDQIDELESSLEDELSAGKPQDLVRDSKRWGRYVAEQVIKYSQTDEAAEAQILEPQPLSYEPPVGDGFWTYSADPERALFPYWGTVRTFVISPEETTTVAPITYSEVPGSPYYEEMVEVYEVNNTAKAQDNEDLWIAEFWSDDAEGLTFSPPARQYAISNQLLKQYELDLEEALTLYVKLGFAMNDAAVSTWKYKYEHMVMRPNVFIHEFIDPDFQTNLFRLVYWPNPSFPGYPSGHSCFASAAGGVFIDFFGNQTSFTDRSHEGRDEFRSTPRQFSSFAEMAEENAFSRIPLGVHIRMDCVEGLRLGYEISDAINAYNLDRNPG